MELGIVKPIGIVDQMTGAYLDYSMSVIVSRALPDVRDGLKPVHRRVLYAMDQMGLQANRSFRKSAGVVGEVLKEYHPHGDASVYDTLVRLVQPWAMRYPLALGQGNWGCFTGDTKIKLLDGSEKTFAELAELPAHEVFYVYSVNESGNIVVGEGRNARVTRKNAALVEVTLDNGAKIRCTPDHRFMLRDGTFKEARSLTSDDSLMPGYFDTAPVREGMNPYLRIMQPATGGYDFVHHLADAFNFRQGLAPRFAGPFVRHHKNFNRYDNRPSNIERMDFLAHLHLHAEHAQEMWLDPQFRAAQRAGVQRYYSRNPHMREYQRQRLIRRNQDLAFRQANGPRISARMRAYVEANPQVRVETAQRMRALWQDPDYRQRMSVALRGIEKRPLTAEQRKEVSRIVAQKSREMWSNENKRAEIIAAIVNAMASDTVRKKLSARARAAWQNPAYRAKYRNDHFSRMAHALWNNPANRDLHRTKIERQWQDEAFRSAQGEGVRASNQRRLDANPEMMRELAQKAATSLRDRWSDGDAHRRKVMRQRTAGYVAGILKQIERDEFDGETYDRLRFANWIPRWKVASQYFDNVEELLDAASHYNHRVISVRYLDEREDVYDITVGEHHNFLLADGAFVHNSVDDDPAAAMRYTETKMSVIASELLADIDTRHRRLQGQLRRPQHRAGRAAGAAAEPAAQRRGGHRRRHGDEHPAAQPARGLRRHHLPHRPSRRDDRGPDAHRARARLPDRRHHPGARGHPQRLYHWTRAHRRARQGAYRGDRARQELSIIVTELPYQVNKADLVKKISELARDKKIDGITDVRDESDRQGMRIVIDLRRDARNLSVLNQLFKFTSMQTTFGANMLALVDGQPRTLTLKQIIQHYVDLPRVGHHAAHEVRSRQGRGAPAHPRRLDHRAG